jgi:hypothetical protein
MDSVFALAIFRCLQIERSQRRMDDIVLTLVIHKTSASNHGIVERRYSV